MLDVDELQMIAANLDIFEDANGLTRPPARWPRSPAVREELRVQAALVAAGQVGWKRTGKVTGLEFSDR